MSYWALPLALLGTTVLWALGLQLIVGRAGLLTFGHAAFFALGGYASAGWTVFVLPLFGRANDGVLALMTGPCVGTIAAALLALGVGGPCLRLRGDYLAAATLGLSQLTENVFFNSATFGGASGFSGVPMLVGLPGIWATVALVWWLRARFDETPLGHAIVCARDDDIVAQSFGISPLRVRLVAFVIGSALAGLAGALYVHAFAFIGPTAAGFPQSVFILLAIVMGGPYTRMGALRGAMMLVVVPELLRFLPPVIDAIVSAPGVAALFPARIASGLVELSSNAMFLFAAFVLWLLRVRVRRHEAPSGAS